MQRNPLIAAALAALVLLAGCGGGDDDKTVTGAFDQGKSGSPASGGEAGVGSRPPSQRTSFLLSKAADGGFPDGPSRNAAVSHDQRIARLIAYESDATNIVGNDSNGKTDIFLVKRAEPFGSNGTTWVPGSTELISKAPDGSPANGASYRPFIDGDSHNKPRCVAFVSDASNLVGGDTNGKPDGFVYDVARNAIQRVTVNSQNKQSNGSTFDISIDGDCERVAFTSDATNLALTKNAKPAWSKAKTSAVPSGKKQVYVHIITAKGHDKVFKGLTFLASASNKGAAGNGDSEEPSMSRSGKAVAFTSSATNLDKGDRSGTPDIYRRTIFRKFAHLGHGKGVQTLQGLVNLVSSAGGKAGNGPSTHPTITDDGRYVAYQTEASNLLPGDSNGVRDIARADLKGKRPKQDFVSKTPIGGIANGPSSNPVISDAGEFILFDSDATNMRPSESVKPDPNGVRDVFLWNAPTRNVSLESRDAENGYLQSPSQHPATSSRGNYVPFESAYPLIDLPLARQILPELIAAPGVLDVSILPQLQNPDVPAPQLPPLPEIPKVPSTPATPSVPAVPTGTGTSTASSSTGTGTSTASTGTSTGTSTTSANKAAAEAARKVASAGQQVYMRYLGPK